MAIFSRFAICTSLTALLAAGPALASTMPAADRTATAVMLGSGPAVGFGWSPGQRWSFGVSAAVPFFFYQDFGTLRYGAWGMYQLLEQDGFYMAGIAGLYGDVYVPDANRYSPVGLQLGAALAYRLNKRLTLRLNIVPGVSLRLPPAGWVVFPPAGGAEIAWRMQDNLELSLGYNGSGDILGLNWIF